MKSNMNFIYITNNPEVGEFISHNGVRWVMVDLENIGKSQRQNGLDTVISAHSIQDIHSMRAKVDNGKLLVRINPIGEHSNFEIGQAIDAGADALLLPYFRLKSEVEKFIKIVSKRCKTFLLVETLDAIKNLKEITKLDGIDYVHIGLNDLHIERNTKFMFEFLADGSIDPIASLLRQSNIEFGIGGVGKYGNLKPPAERVLNEHIRLGSNGVILSRSFMNLSDYPTTDDFLRKFKKELSLLQEHLKSVEISNVDYLNKNKELFKIEVSQVVCQIKEK